MESFPPIPSIAPPSKTEPASVAYPSGPPASVIRRRSSEDLIGELFEAMHDLHFMVDVASGAEFVRGVIARTLPCEGVLIHVFDIDRRQFVVVRAAGPTAAKALLHTTPDRDPLFSQLMRRHGVLRPADPSSEPSFQGGRWAALGIEQVRAAACGACRQGGRYLGVIELANPIGYEPFSEHEAHALDYICKQFAEFLVNRPIVLDRDVIAPKS
jgi:GAF domain-containing protein